MAEKQPTPEEQLLKLIEAASDSKEPDSPSEKQQAPKAAPAKVASASVKGGVGVKTLPSFPKIFSFFSYIKDSFQKKKSSGDAGFSLSLNVKWLNRVLIALVLAGGIYLISDFTLYQSPKDQAFHSVSTADALHPALETISKVQPRELSYYKDSVFRRNPFLPPGSEQPAKTEGATTQAAVPAEGKIAQILAQWKLVGISWGAEPLAMVEDVQSGRTHFLKNGQQIGEVKVQSITKQKVVISYEGEEGELY